MNITFIVPLYNEEERLQKFFPTLVKKIKKYTPQKTSFKIILVNDGSTDQTYSIMKKYQRQSPLHVHLVSYKVNKGKGHAIKKGVEKATGTFIFFTDIDLSVDLSILTPSIRALKENQMDIVIASRRLSKSILIQRQPFLREKLGVLYVFFTNKYLGINFSDLTCGFKGFRKSVAKKIFSKLHNKHWAFDSELLFLADKYQYKVHELPASWTNNEKSRVHIGLDSIRSFWETVQIRMYDLKNKYSA